jgi:S-formylglutathione hydrolase FrmB
MTSSASTASSFSAPAAELISLLYGGLVPEVRAQLGPCLHSVTWSLASAVMLQTWNCEIALKGQTKAWSFSLQLPVDASAQTPVPVLISGDACWPHALSLNVRRAFARRGVALAWFNRLDFAADAVHLSEQHAHPLRPFWPDTEFAALSAWSWAYQRMVDVLLQMPAIDAQGIGVIGHSRGGKAALLAGACDPRIALTVSNNSGTAGAASLQIQNEGAESLDSMVKQFPHWVGPDMQNKAAQQKVIEIDMPSLWSCIAPQGLLILQAQQDVWANPAGTQASYAELRRLRLDSSARKRLKLVQRQGTHPMIDADWLRALNALCSVRPVSHL